MLALIAFLLLIPLHGIAQTTNATCTNNSTTSWLFNADGESPCLVWSKLQSLCLPSTSYLNVPPLLSSRYGYNPPSSPGTLCQCNVVAYGLMVGCSWCQVGNSSSWLSEEQYRASCSEYNNTSLSFAETEVTLPGYAFATWNGSKWDAEQALASPTVTVAPTVASTTLSRSFPQSSGTLTASPPSNPSTTSSSSTSPPDNTTTSSSADAVTRWGPIVGGIAGGMIAIFALGLLWRRYRRRGPPAQGTHGTAARSRAQEKGSILDMITDRPSSKESRRDTEYLADSQTFAAPRPAPKPSGLRYTTTSERLQNRQGSGDSISFYDGSGDDAPLPPPRILAGPGESEARHSFGPILSSSTESFMDENGSPKAPPRAYHTSHLVPETQTGTLGLATAHTHSIDFSAAASPTEARAPSFTDTRTLPSLYEPRTGAERYTHVSEEPVSPESRYPMTGRPASDATIGAALGSGRMAEWNRADRESVPEVPRRNSRQLYP